MVRMLENVRLFICGKIGGASSKGVEKLREKDSVIKSFLNFANTKKRTGGNLDNELWFEHTFSQG